MRNLKRALSLALASIMVIGMMVTGAGAAFSDQESIKNTEAVEVVNVLGIIVGKPGGSFAPSELVDRASMAKMITLALNGGIEPVLGTKVKPTYSDIKGTWAESFIEYCSASGIIAGDGAGKFNPTGSVTGSQAAKMLLVALGYESAAFVYTGADWEMNVARDANKAGIYAGLTGLQASAPLSRDNAAQMIYNALNSKIMTKNLGLEPSTGKVTYSYVLGNKTLLEDKFNVIRMTGVVTANEFASLKSSTTNAKNKTDINIVDNGGQLGFTVGMNFVANVATGMNELGKTVSLFVKTNVSGITATATPSKCTVIGVPIVTADNRVLTLTEEKTATGMTNYLSDNKMSLTGAAYSQNYTNITAPSSIATTNAAGVTLTVIDNDNDDIAEYVIQFSKTFGQVIVHNTTGNGSISVTNPNSNRNPANTLIGAMASTKAKDEVVGFDTVVKDDYVMFYEVAGVKHVEKMTSIDATISSIRGAKIVANGTTYGQSGLVNFVNDNNQLLAAAVNDSLGKTVKLLLDDGGNVVYVTNATSTTNYAYVEGVDGVQGSVVGLTGSTNTKLVFADGTSSIVRAYETVSIINTVTATGAKSTVATNEQIPYQGKVYTYSMNSDNVYELKGVNAAAAFAGGIPAAPAGSTNAIGDLNDNIAGTAAITAVNKGQTSLPGVAAMANANTVFVVKNGTSYTLYTGIANVPNLTAPSGGAFAAVGAHKGNTMEIVFVTASDISGTAKTMYAINDLPTITREGNKTTYTYDVVFEGKYQQMTGGSNLFANGSGLYTGVAVNGTNITAGGVYSNRGALAMENSKGIVSNGIAVAGITNFTYDAKTVFLTLDMDGKTADEMVQPADIGSVVIDTTPGSTNTSTIVIVAGTGDRLGAADVVYILK